jgi:hypothetical protein
MRVMSESHSEHLVLRPDVAVAVLEDGAVLLDLNTKYFFSINTTGWTIIRMFELGKTLEQVRAQCREWSGGKESGREVETFLRMLVDERLVAGDDRIKGSQEPDISLKKVWKPPTIEKHSKPLQRIMTSAFDPSIPLAE